VNASGGEHHDYLSRLPMSKKSKSGEGQSSHVPSTSIISSVDSFPAVTKAAGVEIRPTR